MYKVITYYTKNQPAVDDYKTKTSRAWTDHAVYTRDAVTNVMSELDNSVIVHRLMKNQDDIGDLLRRYYLSADVDAIVEMLKEHISLASVIVESIKSDEDYIEFESQWRDNCDMLVNKLIEVNPLLAKTNIRSLWNSHLDLTLNEAKFKKDMNWSSDMMTFDKILSNVGNIADTIATSVVEQFPIQFCTETNEEESWTT